MRKYFLLFILLSLAGCSSNAVMQDGGANTSAPQAGTSAKLNVPPIIRVLGTTISGYSYVDQYTYPEGLGYSVRYNNINNPGDYADIYIWSVAAKDSGLSHKGLVAKNAREAVTSIYQAEQMGSYQKVEALSSQSANDSGRRTEFFKLSFLKGGVKSYSYLYVSEHKGKYLKARVTMPAQGAGEDAAVNNFVLPAFERIAANIDKV